MARSRGGKVRSIGKPDPKNTRRQSNPTTPTEKKQAIADDVEAAIYSYQPILAMESEVRQNDLKTVMGIGGPNLKLFTEQLEEDYQDVVGSRSKQSQSEKEEAAELRQVSRDTTVDDDRTGDKPNKRRPNKPQRSNRSRRK